MATAKPFSSNPFPLGVCAPTSGTPVALTHNYTDLTNEIVHRVRIRALPGNAGTVYVLSSSSAADTTNYLNVLDALAKGEYVDLEVGFAPAVVNVDRIWIDVSNTGDKAIAFILEN